MKGSVNSSRTSKQLPIESKFNSKKTSNKNLITLGTSGKNAIRNSLEDSIILTTVQSGNSEQQSANTSLNKDKRGGSTAKVVKFAPKINIDLHNKISLGGVSSNTIRKISPTSKKVNIGKGVGNQMYNSLNKEVKINTRNKILKGGNSPSFIKGTVDSKKNMRYNSNSYSSSFCQSIVASTSGKDRLLIEEEMDARKELKKTVIESYVKPTIVQRNPNLSNYNRNTLDNNNIICNVRNRSQSPSKMTSFIEMFGRISKLLTQTKDDITNNNSSALVENISQLTSDIEEIYKQVQSKQEIEKVSGDPNPQEDEIYESTKFNINLIKSSSERRDSIYRKFFDICSENIKDITGIVSIANIFTFPIQQNIKVENITNNIINNHTSNANNVNVNVNVNVNTINNLSSKSNKDLNHLKKMSRMISRKKMSKHQFHIYNAPNEDDAVDLSESMTCEGVSVKMPFKSYNVNKPKEEHMNYRVYTEGDLYDSDEGSKSDSELFDLVDSYYKEQETNRNKLDKEEAKFARFKKTRSKSLLNLKKQRGIELTEEEKVKKKKKEVIRLFQDVSISRIDMDESDDDDIEYNENQSQVLNSIQKIKETPAIITFTSDEPLTSVEANMSNHRTRNTITNNSGLDSSVNTVNITQNDIKQKEKNCVIY